MCLDQTHPASFKAVGPPPPRLLIHRWDYRFRTMACLACSALATPRGDWFGVSICDSGNVPASAIYSLPPSPHFRSGHWPQLQLTSALAQTPTQIWRPPGPSTRSAASSWNLCKYLRLEVDLSLLKYLYHVFFTILFPHSILCSQQPTFLSGLDGKSG